jgi:hypothetical protein
MVPILQIENANQASMSSRLSRVTWLRLGAVLLLSLLVHLSLIGALPGLPKWHDPVDEPLVAIIEPLPPKPVAAVVPERVPPAPKPRAEKSLAEVTPVPHQAPPVPVPESPPVAAATVIQSTTPAADLPTPPGAAETPNTPSDGAGGANTAAFATGAGPATPPAAPSTLPLAPAPPAARPIDANLSYRVTALDPSKPNQTYAGQGTLVFHSEQNSYHASLEVNAQALFVSISVLTSVSDGAIGSDGLEPSRYSEARRNRPTGVASFSRATDGSTDLSSTQSKDVSKAPPGAQDRLTVLLQIGALMQANPAMKHAGASFAIPVAGERGGIDVWNFVVQAEEQVQTDTGKRAGWHVQRVVRPGTNDRGLDIWVESAAPYLPLRVLYTDPGDKTIDLVLSTDPAHPSSGAPAT